MGKWADLVLTGSEQDNAAVNSMQRMLEQDLARRNSRPPSYVDETLPRFGGPKNYPENAASVPPEQVSPPQQAAPAGKWSNQVLGGTPWPEPVAAPPAAKQESWGEWAVNSVRGRRDPREASTGTVFEQFPGQLRNPTANAAIMGASDEAMGDIISQNLGGDFIRREKDANGYDVIVSRGANGQEQRGYVNAPGLDSQDISRAIYGALPYAVTGGAAGGLARGAGIGVNALAQGVAAGATSVAGDLGTMAQGSEQGLDIGKAGAMAAFGAAGPPVSAAGGALWRRFVTIPGLVDSQSGMLTARGIEAAKRAGVDPADVTPDFAQAFAKTFAQTKDPAQAAVKAGAERYGIPATQGQVTKDPYLLTQEEGMRRRLFGEGAQDVMLGFDRRQGEAIQQAALGTMGTTKNPSIATQIAPGRDMGFAARPDEIGASIQSGVVAARDAAKTAERAAWKDATSLEATDEALKLLPDALNAKLGGRLLNEQVTPTASAMAKEIDRIIAGEAPQKAAGWVSASPSRNVDQMRRTLLDFYKSAKDPADETASRAIYDGFNEWIGEAAKASLLKGDPAAAMKLVEARGFTREVMALFSPRAADGTVSPAGARLSKVLDPAKTDSGESVIQALFGSHGSSTPQAGATSALNNIKTAFERFAPETGAQAWNDIRFAYWSRLVTNKGGDVLGAQAIVSNLKTAFQTKSGVMQTLYSRQEQAEIRKFLKAMEAVAYKPPNASGSGYAAASFIKDGLLKLLDSFGLGKPASAALNYTGVGSAWNTAGARAAVSQSVRPVRPNLTPAITGAGSSYENQSRGR